MNVAIVIPTRNGGELWAKSALSLKEQSDYTYNIIIIDSNSSDNTVSVAKNISNNVLKIHESEFNHGGTRNLGCKHLDEKTDIVVFLTQDAILASSESLKNIIESFSDANVAVAFGRQLPHDDATPIAAHARFFNYPEVSYKSSLQDKESKGIKTIFVSNSFSAYRMSVFRELGGFPENTILCEDMYFAAKAVLRGYKVAYVANATVYHSHNYKLREEFRRYFDIGVFHNNEPWIKKSFGGAGGEGKKFILSEFKYLLNKKPMLIPVALINNVFKFIGYKAGGYNSVIPKSLKKKLSMHKNFWNRSI